MKIILNKQNLSDINELVAKPQYDYENRKAGIVHIGIGAFHKAHQATFTDDMMAQSKGDYKIIAVSLRSATNRDLLKKQDYLYSAVERSSSGEKTRIIGALEKVLVAPENPKAVIEVLSNPDIKAVTTTITEKGYCLLPGNTGLDINHSDIQHDLVNFTQPKTMVGFMVQACAKRMRDDQQGFAFISCDNLPDNSQLAKKAITDFAKHLDDKLVIWIEKNVSFCNSMVDRIVPAVQATDIALHTEIYGYIDNALVGSEPFRQWVIEDNFKGERPPWDLAGALFVDDVAQYEKLKLRFLNGSHSALAYLGKLSGHQFINQAIEHRALHCFVKSLMSDMKKSLEGEMSYDFQDYGETIIERFSNSEIQYETQQVATDGSQKLPQRIFQPLLELSKQGYVSKPLCTVIATWLLYLEGKNEAGEPHEISDPLAEILTKIMTDNNLSYQLKLQDIMNVNGFFPSELQQNTEIVVCILEQINLLKSSGIIEVLTD